MIECWRHPIRIDRSGCVTEDHLCYTDHPLVDYNYSFDITYLFRIKASKVKLTGSGLTVVLIHFSYVCLSVSHSVCKLAMLKMNYYWSLESLNHHLYICWTSLYYAYYVIIRILTKIKSIEVNLDVGRLLVVLINFLSVSVIPSVSQYFVINMNSDWEP